MKKDPTEGKVFFLVNQHDGGDINYKSAIEGEIHKP